MRFTPLLPVIGWILIGMAAALALPMAVAISEGEDKAAVAFAVTAVTTLFVGGAIMLASPAPKGLDILQHGIFALGAFWLFLPVVAAAPFLLADVLERPSAAYFEAVSGLTTTGATALATHTGVPKALLIWRAELQWFGGLATILGISILLAPARRNEMPDYGALNLEPPGPPGSWLPRSAWRTIVPLYCTITLLAWIGLAMSGIPTFDGACLALAAVATGGFMPRDGTMELYGSTSAVLVLTAAMFAGAVSLVWLRALITFKWRSMLSNREPLWVALAIVALGLLIADALIAPPPREHLLEVARAGAFGLATAASYITTSGFPVATSAHESLPTCWSFSSSSSGPGVFLRPAGSSSSASARWCANA